MEQKEALEAISLDLARINKRRCMILAILLLVSVAINIILSYALIKDCAYKNAVIGTCTPAMLSTASSKTSSSHIVTRQKLRDIYDVKTFDDLLERSTLTDNEKYILRSYYLKKRSMQAIAMDLNYSPDRIRHIHQSILKKINKLL